MPMHIVSTNKTIRGTDNKGRGQFLLRLTSEDVTSLIAALQDVANSGESIALDVRTTVKQSANGGSFDSSFIMVRDYGPGNGANKGTGTTGTNYQKKSFGAKSKPQAAVAQSQTSRIKAEVD